MSTETIVQSGFYDSVNGDRKYNAKQMTAIFDGIINDGVFAVGDAFQTSASSGNSIIIGTGRAWFNSTWVHSDVKITLTVPTVATAAYDAVDLVILEVDRSSSVRAASVKITAQYSYTDTSITDPNERRTTAINAALGAVLANSSDRRQIPIAAIYRASGFTGTIAQKDITYLVGTERCPFVTGILDTVNVDNLVARWESEFHDWFANIKTDLDGDVAARLTANVEGILSGTIPVGDANKLGGFAAHYYRDPGHINIGGYFGAMVRASVVSNKSLGESQLRNIYAGTDDMTAGTTTLSAGSIYIVYE